MIDAEKQQSSEKQCEEYLNGWKRAKADLLNYQKDEAKRFEEIVKFGYVGVIKELLVVLDSFDLALRGMGEKQDQGFVMIQGQLLEIVEKFGVEKIACNIGGAFDPALNEAIEEIESELPQGFIVEEVSSGYTMQGRVLRPTKVKIAKEKESNNK